MLSVKDILQPENVSYTDCIWTWAAAHMLHNGADWQITTITDTAPIEIVFLSKGEALTDYMIEGNTIQDGTPTLSDPVAVQGCGEWDATAQQYKIPIICGGETNNLYLGSCQTARRIKKLVLTGDEDWSLQGINSYGIANFWFRIYDRMTGSDAINYCTHFEKQTTNATNVKTAGFFCGTTNALYIRVDQSTADTEEAFKAYIAGKGITVWYVLAEPETAIVNEPLMKIGDYADTISFAQTGVTIPTVSGANTLLVDTTVQPSSVSITGNIKEAQYERY